MCVECLGFAGDPIKECTSPKCPLYPYRRTIRHITEEDRQAMRDAAAASPTNFQRKEAT